MTEADEIKKEAIREGILPNFPLILKYSNSNSKSHFYRQYSFFKTHYLFEKGKRIIRKYNLQEWQGDLLCFLIVAHLSYKENIWAKNVSKASEDKKALKQIKSLNRFCNQLQTYGGYKKIDGTDPVIEKIVFKGSENDFTVDSHLLCTKIIALIQEHYFKNKANINVKLLGLDNIDSKKYINKFVKSLNPLINYLDKETIKWGSKNKIYEFVCDFIGILDFEIMFTPTKIKDALRR